jgi:hypothetical protein
MIDQTTLFLYSPFEREMADPTRYPIKGLKQFENFIDSRNGESDIYCDLYPYPFNGMIDKIYFDIDGIENGMKEALPFAQLFYEFLTKDKHLNVIPVASGKKGFNLYVLLKEQSYPNAKQLLHDVAYSLIVDCFGKVSQFTYVDSQGREHPTTAMVDEKGNILQLIYIDPKVIGDVRRFSRIPNTLRPPDNNAFCTYLDPDKFSTMTLDDVYHTIKHTNTFAYEIKTYTTLKDIPINPNLDSLFVQSKTNGNNVEIQYPKSRNLDAKALELLLRPCLFKNMLSPEPRHDVRVAATGALKSAGLTEQEIFNLYSKLQWVDFAPETTLTQIQHCSPIIWSKKTLQKSGICFNCGMSCK